MLTGRLWFVLIVTLLLVGLGSTGAAPACADPEGCLWLRPGEPVTLGLAGSRAGTGLTPSLAAQSGAEQAVHTILTTPGHGLQLQSFYSPCLPELFDPSYSELSAAQHTLAILGPTCLEGLTDFEQRLTAAAAVSLSPVPFSTPQSSFTITFSPDLKQLAHQAANLAQGLNYSEFTVKTAEDPPSQAFMALFCARLKELSLACSAGSAEAPPGQGEASSLPVWVSLQSPGDLPIVFVEQFPGQPLLAITLSPPASSALTAPLLFWVGPSFWQSPPVWLNNPALASMPATDLAALLAYSSIDLAYQAAQQSAQRLWDGSWLIPRQVFRLQLQRSAAQSEFYRYACPTDGIDCLALPLSLFQWTGKEYKFIKS